MNQSFDYWNIVWNLKVGSTIKLSDLSYCNYTSCDDLHYRDVLVFIFFILNFYNFAATYLNEGYRE